jgi:hypothetical protein
MGFRSDIAAPRIPVARVSAAYAFGLYLSAAPPILRAMTRMDHISKGIVATGKTRGALLLLLSGL